MRTQPTPLPINWELVEYYFFAASLRSSEVECQVDKIIQSIYSTPEENEKLVDDDLIADLLAI